MSGLTAFPTEILTEIFSNLDYSTLNTKVRAVCHRFSDIIRDIEAGPLINNLYRFAKGTESKGFNGGVGNPATPTKPEDRFDSFQYKLHPCIDKIRLKCQKPVAGSFNFNEDVGFFNSSGEFTALVSTSMANERAFSGPVRGREWKNPEEGDYSPCGRSAIEDGPMLQMVSVKEFLEFYLNAVVNDTTSNAGRSGCGGHGFFGKDETEGVDYRSEGLMSWCKDPIRDGWGFKRVYLDLKVGGGQQRDLDLFARDTRDLQEVRAMLQRPSQAGVGRQEAIRRLFQSMMRGDR